MTATHENPEDPLDVAIADEGVVLVSPDGAETKLTREAAAATGRRLLHAAGADADVETYQKPLG